ncbi:MAG: protein kinase [Gemmataceae bacterium]|nr:protein kinase [Gemmataceae bacterium]MCI0737548.1 protein kinase [Gemmataceae bacterium]
MKADEPDDCADDLASQLISWDEALAAGELPTLRTIGVAPEPRLHKTVACVDLLRRLWPRPESSPLAPREDNNSPIESSIQRFGPFEIRGELGRGGFGIVFLAHDTRLGRDVALKVPRTDVLVSADLRARFQQEARAAAGLDHPNLVPLYEAGEVGPISYLASAYCPGITLAEWLRLQEKPAPFKDAASLLEILATAVQHAHERGIIHRDLKPANVMLVSGGVVSGADDDGTTHHSPLTTHQEPLPLTSYQPRITDFGLAKLLDGQPQQTHSGHLLGTPTYMAPEQAEGRGQIGPAADVYALGVILYELFTGRPPFQADSGLATLLLVRKEEPVSPSRLRPKLPRDLETICLKCLEKEPTKRYAAAQDLADDLRRFLNAEPIRARPIGALGRVAKWIRRRPATAALVAVSTLAALLLLTVLVISDVQIREKQKQTENALQSTTEAKNHLAQALDREWQTQYLYRIRLAYMSWQEANVMQAQEFLTSCLPKPGQKDLRGWEWHYLQRLCHPELLLVRTDNSNKAFAVTFSPDGTRVVLVQDDKTVSVRDVASGNVLRTLPGFSSIPRSNSQAAVSPDGKLLALAGYPNHVLKVWSLEDGRELRNHRGDQLAFSPDGKSLAAADFQDNTVRVYDAGTGAELRSCRLPLDRLCSLVFRADGLWVASPNSKESTIQIWNADTGERCFELRDEATFVTCLAFAPDGQRLASADGSGNVKLWNMRLGQLEAAFARHPAPMSCVAFSPDGRRLAVGDSVGSLKILDTNGHELLTLRGHLRSVSAIAFSPDGSLLASAGLERMAVWHVTKDPEAFVFRGHEGFVRSLAFAQLGRLASVGGDGTVKVWEPATGRVLLDLPTRMGGLQQVMFSPDGDRLLVCDRSGRGKQLDAVGRVLETFNAPKDKMRWAGAVCPQWACLASVDFANSIKLWDWKASKLLFTLTGHADSINAVAFSPDSLRLASASNDRTVQLWDTATGSELFTLRGHDGNVQCVAFSWDGRLLASAGNDKLIRVWDVSRGKEIMRIRNRFGRNLVNAVAFSPDGRRLASSGFDPTVTLWDVETGEEALTLRCQRMGIGTLAFSPDGRYLAAASNDATVTVWDAAPQ